MQNDLETLEFNVQDAVARITLNRPKAANSINLQMAKDLMEVALHCHDDESVRAILIDAQGKMFCAGGDIGGFASAGDKMPALLQEMTTYLHAATALLVRGRAPVIAAVGGTAAGAGFSLATAADLVLAGEGARFTMAYTQVGLTPDGSSTYFLPRLVGKRRAMELMLTNRVLSAAEALEWGIVNRVVADTDLAAESEKLASQLASGPTEAFGGVKKLLASSDVEGFESQLQLESSAIANSARSEDAKAGVAAFLAKKRATFSGS